MKSSISGIANAYIYTLFIVAACYYDNGYFNIIDVKIYICRLLLLLFLPLLIVLTAVMLTVNFTKKRKQCGELVKQTDCGKKRFCAVDAAVAVFAVASIISCFTGNSVKSAVLGSDGWGCGAMLIVLLSLMYIFISRFTDVKDNMLLLPVLLGGGIIYIWSILNYFGIDIDHMHEGFYNPEVTRFYLAGIGNVNNFVPYMSMMTPFTVIAFSRCEKTVWKILMGIYLFLSGFCTVIIVTDSIYLGIGVAGIAIIIYALGSVERIRKVCIPLAVFFAGAACTAITDRYFSDRVNIIDGISAVFLKYFVFAGSALLLTAVHFLFKLRKREFPGVFIWVSRAVICIAVIAAAVAGIVFTAKDFNDEWGSNRGFIWSRAAVIFSSLPVVQKIFGVGCDCFGAVFHGRYNDEIVSRFGMTVSNAHNEPLQYLISTGVFGLLSYCSLFICSLVEVIKNKERPPLSVAAVFGIIGYAGQALLNNPHPFNCSVLFFLFAVLAAGSVQSDYKRTSLPLSADS